MKKSTRRVSMLLAVLMIIGLLTAFPVITASAATNFVSGKAPTVTNLDGTAATNSNATAYAALTDGVFPTVAAMSELTAAYTNAPQFNGTGKSYYFIFDLGSTQSNIQSVVVTTFVSSNRAFDTVAFNLEVSNDGSTYTAASKGVVTSAVSADCAHITTYTLPLTAAASGRYLRITLGTTGYVLQPTEIQVLDSGLQQGEVSVSTDAPTLVDGNYAYGATYTVARDDGFDMASDAAYRNAQQADKTFNKLTDGYVGTGATGGTAYYTCSYVGTSKTYTIVFTMSSSHNDVGYVQLVNSLFIDGNAQFQDPIMNSIKYSEDGISYTNATFTSEVVTTDGGAHTLTYTFAAATAKYVEINFTSNNYVAGFDEVVIGAGYVNPDPDPNPDVPSTVINATTATNYALASQGAYYNYVSANALPSASYNDDTWSRASMAFGKFGTGDLNNGAYATGTYADVAWIGWVYSADYDTAKTVVMEFDLAKVVGNLDKIVINSLTYGGAEDIATQQIVSEIKVSYADINRNYGSEVTATGVVTDTAITGLNDAGETVEVGTAHKAEFGVKGPSTGARYVKISIPKTVYRLFIDEIEIWAATGFGDTTSSAAPETSNTPDVSTPDSSAPVDESNNPQANWEQPCEGSHVIDRYADFVLSAEYGTYASITDAIGTELATNFTGFKVTVTTKNLVLPWKQVEVTNDDGTTSWVDQQATGVIGTNFRLFFDTTKLTPLFVDFAGLAGDTTAGTFPGPVVKFPTYTYTSRGQTYTDPSITGLVKPYSMADGSLVDPSNANQIFTKPLGFIDNNYIVDATTYEGVKAQPFYGKTADDEFVYAYYFSVAEGCEGESFTFNIPDRASYVTVDDYVPRVFQVFQSTFHDGMAHCTGPVTAKVPEAAPTTYTVTFKGIDGTVIDTQTVEEGAAATAPAAPAVAGKNFTGWDVAFDNITADTVVTALYEDVMVTVTFVAAEGGAITGTASVEVVYGTDLSTVAFPAYAANEGYEFDAWSQTSGALTADTTVTATFKLIPVVEADFFVFADTTDTTNIVLDETAATITFKAGGYNIDDLKALFVDSDLTFTNKSGTAVTTGTTKIGTNCTVTSTINGETSTITVILLGDVDGNGTVNLGDYRKVKNAVNDSNTKETFLGYYFTAANVVGPTVATVNLGDYRKIKNCVTADVIQF